MYLEQTCKERKGEMKERKLAGFSPSSSLGASGLRLSDCFVKGTHLAFDITT